jgi:hypothetical protein
MSPPKPIRCKLCGQLVVKNYDHVGDCASGACSGTFEHPHTARPCKRSGTDLNHTEVTT